MFFLLPLALVSGFLTVISPCILPILPIVLASGVDGNKKRVNGVVFGLITSFSIATLFLASVITAFNISADTLRDVISFLLLLIGLSIVFPIWNSLQVRLEQVFNRPRISSKSGFNGGFLTGLGLGVVWTPCVGPIVATVSTLAAYDALSFFSFLLVFAYAIGVGVPLWFIALKGGEVTARLAFFRQNPEKVRKTFGIVLIATAIFIYLGFERKIQTWFLDNLPESWSQITIKVEEAFGVEDILLQMTASPDQVSSGGSFDFAGSGGTELAETNRKLTLSDLDVGCFGGKDCIPSIDNPVFESVSTAKTWLNPEDIIFGVSHNGVARAYPQRILNWHEIVNDNIGGDPVVVTFCPLCGTAISFEPYVDGQVSEFGVSGRLYNSDLVMYDRNDDNLWQQATGEAIIGEAADRKEILEPIATTTTTWEAWLKKYPDTQILSRETGFSRDYSQYPYGTYEEDGRIIFGVQNSDNRFHPKTVTLGVLIPREEEETSDFSPEFFINDVPKVYILDDLKEVLAVDSSIEDTVGDVTLVISRSIADEFTFTNKETSEEVVALRGFWFAWVAFYPDTLIHTTK